jgi:predicted solute-binding protein
VDLRGFETELMQLRYLNQSHLDDLSGEVAAENQMDRAVLQQFYSNCLHYTLDNVFLAGLRHFGKELADAHLIERNPPIRLYRSPSGTSR